MPEKATLQGRLFTASENVYAAIERGEVQDVEASLTDAHRQAMDAHRQASEEK
ncbi:hypothetical protein ACFQ0X_43475 [Streptomyces rectiviolaceus]|uniref:hypothetical protein n=1 Tax=Streptomyces rectiviolaceus TaxID=332591 RepID=UPI003629E23D